MKLQFEYVCIYLTSECNLKCKFCYRLASKTCYLDARYFELLLEKIKALGFRTINITGGEPLLHPFFKDFIHKAAEMDFYIVLSTNSILLDLNDPIYKKVHLIVVPIDGSNSVINSKVRGTLQYKFAQNVINKYINGDYSFKLKINTVMTVYNYNDLMNMADMLHEKHIFWRIFYCKDKGDYNNIETNELIDTQLFVKKINEIDEKYPGLLMVEACKRDVNDDLAYSFVTTDGEFVVSQGGKYEYIGNLISLDSKDIIDIVSAKRYTVVEHRGKKY